MVNGLPRGSWIRLWCTGSGSQAKPVPARRCSPFRTEGLIRSSPFGIRGVVARPFGREGCNSIIFFRRNAESGVVMSRRVQRMTRYCGAVRRRLAVSGTVLLAWAAGLCTAADAALEDGGCPK